MPTELLANAFTTTLAAPASATDLTITTNSAAPAALQNGQFRMVTQTGEWILVTGGQNTTTWNVQRGIEGTTPTTHSTGESLTHKVTGGGIANYVQTNLPATIVKASPGPAPGANGYKTLPQAPDYVLSVVGAGVGAINTKTGNTDYSTSSGDHAAVVQSVANNLLNAAGPTGGLGGKISFDGHLSFTTQLVLNPNIALIGGGMHGYHSASPTWNGSVITSTFNGPCILIKNDARGSTFVHLEKFLLYGSGQTSGLAGQHGIAWLEDIANGNVLDTLLMHVGVFAMGGDAFNISGATSGNATKVLANECYAEFCGGNGITQLHNADLWWKGGYVTGHTGNGYDGSGGNGGVLSWMGGNISNCAVGMSLLSGATQITVSGVGISGNTSNGILVPSSVACATVLGCTLRTNGGPTIPQIDVPSAALTSSDVSISNNEFQDGRGASAVTNHVRLASTSVVTASVVGNMFYGQQGDAISWTARRSNKLTIKNNHGYNNTKGKVASPFQTYGGGVGSIGAGGPNAGTVVSTTYFADGTDIMLVVSGGTGVSITIGDPAGNTIQSGLASYSGVLPNGYTINFGAYTVAPTVYAGVV